MRQKLWDEQAKGWEISNHEKSYHAENYKWEDNSV